MTARMPKLNRRGETDGRGLLQCAFLASCVLVLAACGPEPGTPEEQIRSLIALGEQAAEERDVGDLADLVAEYYADRHGHDKTRLLQTVRIYFVRNQSIHLITDIKTIEFPTDRRAAVTMTVAMAGRDATRDGVLPINTDLLWFDLEIEDLGDGDWQLIRADWR